MAWAASGFRSGCAGEYTTMLICMPKVLLNAVSDGYTNLLCKVKGPAVVVAHRPIVYMTTIKEALWYMSRLA